VFPVEWVASAHLDPDDEIWKYKKRKMTQLCHKNVKFGCDNAGNVVF
jgi:hypothetical protein